MEYILTAAAFCIFFFWFWFIFFIINENQRTKQFYKDIENLETENYLLKKKNKTTWI
jgi:hypothetical protein